MPFNEGDKVIYTNGVFKIGVIQGSEYLLITSKGKAHFINYGGGVYKHWFSESELTPA